MNIDFLKQLAHALAIQFGRDCEVVIHDLSERSLEHSIVYIENAHVSKRNIGDGPSQVVLEALSKDPSKIQDHLGYICRASDGKIMKSSTIFVRDEATNKILYILSINYDITNILLFQNSIRSLVNEDAGFSPFSITSKSKPQIHNNVEELLVDLIEQAVALVGKPVSLMNKNDKIEAIKFLNESGAFLITKSGDKISQYFEISKYTLYSYIKKE